MSTAGPHFALGPVDQPLTPGVYTCNRLCRQATPPGPGWAFADWWRRAMRRSTVS
jgi:hypothetical protein